MSDQLDAATAVCELANLALADGCAPFSTDGLATSDAVTVLRSLRARLRYQPLAVADLNWALCIFITGVITDNHNDTQRLLRQLAREMTRQGYSSEILVALLAAGHQPGDALAATLILETP